MEKKLFLSVVFSFLCIHLMLAQNKSETESTIIVIEKEEDINGKISKKKIVLQGEDAEEYLRENGDEIDDVMRRVETEEREESVTVEMDDEGKKKIKIVTKEKGSERIMEWDGEGEMPAEMAEIMERADVEIDDEGGNRRIRIEMEGEDIEIDERGSTKGLKKVKKSNPTRGYVFENEEEFFGPNHNKKPRLGIMVETEGDRVIVKDVILDSPADQAGIVEGDQIAKVDDTKIDSVERLLAELNTHNQGDEIEVVVRTGDMQKKVLVKL